MASIYINGKLVGNTMSIIFFLEENEILSFERVKDMFVQYKFDVRSLLNFGTNNIMVSFTSAATYANVSK